VIVTMSSPCLLLIMGNLRRVVQTPQGRHGLLEKRGLDGLNSQRWLQKTGCGVFGLPTRDIARGVGEFPPAAW